MKHWDDLSKSDKNKWLAVNVLNWEIRKLHEGEDGSFYSAYFNNDNFLGYIDSYEFDPVEYMEDAILIANKLGIALIPQSDGDKFNWFACDVDRVSYRGSEIAIEELYDSGVSERSASEAICHAAYLSLSQKSSSN